MSAMLKHLLVISAMGTSVFLAGCVANPGNKPYGSYDSSDIKSKLVYDLNKKNIRYAENQLQDRGYSESGREGNNSWWYNDQNNNCYQIEEAGGVVKKIHYKGASECNKRGQRSDGGKHHNQSHHNHNSHNNGGSKFGKTPNKLADMVGEKAGQAEDELAQLGYSFSKGAQTGLSKTGYYVETRTGECVAVVTSDGRFQSITYTAQDACE